MKTTEDTMVFFTVLSIVCACAVAYQTAPFTPGSKTDEINWILSTLRKEMNTNTKSDSVQRNLYPSSSVNSIKVNSPESDADERERMREQGTLPVQSLQGRPLLSALLSRGDNSEIDVKKRQGNWDYDYGLGGGRFGKRSGYSDYPLGGGRFGRDVDHVTNLSEDDVDFEDPIED